MELLVQISSYLKEEEKYITQIATSSYFDLRKYVKLRLIYTERKNITNFLAIKTNENTRFVRNYLCEDRNEKVTNYPRFVTKLIITDIFNGSLTNLPKTIKSILINKKYSYDIHSFPPMLERLEFSLYHHVVSFPPKLKHLIFDTFLEKKDIQWPKRLRTLTIGNFVSQKQIDNLPQTLKTLTIKTFNTYSLIQTSIQKLVITSTDCVFKDLPANIKSISSAHSGLKFLSLFPESLKKIKFFEKIEFVGFQGNNLICAEFREFPDVIKMLPSSIKILKIGRNYTHPCDSLPPNLVNLIIESNICSKIKDYPSTIRKLQIRYYDGRKLPEFITYLKLEHSDKKVQNLPTRLKHLRLGSTFNTGIELPPNLEIFDMGHNFNQSITFPESLIELYVGYNFNQIVILPVKLKKLEINGNEWNNDIPNTLESLSINDKFIELIGKNPKIPNIIIVATKRINNPFTSHYLYEITSFINYRHYFSNKKRNTFKGETIYGDILDWVDRIEITKPFLLKINY